MEDIEKIFEKKVREVLESGKYEEIHEIVDGIYNELVEDIESKYLKNREMLLKEINEKLKETFRTGGAEILGCHPDIKPSGVFLIMLVEVKEKELLDKVREVARLDLWEVEKIQDLNLAREKVLEKFLGEEH